MANKSVVDLTARTATADSDLIHVNSGGTDYKETKANFLQGDFYHVFANDSTITSQVDALPTIGTWNGYINSYGAQSASGVPENSDYFVEVRKQSANNARITLINKTTYVVYTKIKNSTWASSWTKEPTRSEIDSLNSSLTNKQDDLKWSLAYDGSIAANSSYTFSSTGNHLYFVVFGTWNYKGVFFLNTMNGSSPTIFEIIHSSICSVSASGNWGFTISNGSASYSMPIYIFQFL